MFSGILSLFQGKKEEKKEEVKLEQTKDDENINHILNNLGSTTLEGEEVQGAYFVSEDDYKGRRFPTETNDEFFKIDRLELLQKFNEKVKLFN